MKDYNPTELQLNMPVKYVTATEGVKEFTRGSIMTGHFAGFDDDGAPFVFEDGGTSYTRTPQQIVKCIFAYPVSKDDQCIYVTNKMKENPKETFSEYSKMSGFNYNPNKSRG